MKKKIKLSKWLILPVVAVTLASMLAVGITTANFLDNETSTGNTATGWSSSAWTQTTQADFEAGVVSANLSTTSNPGSVILTAPVTTYSPSGASGNWTNGAGGFSSNNNYATFTPVVNTATNNPSSNNGTAWTNPTNAWADGTNAANITAGNPSGSNSWGNYGFSLGSTNITRVRVISDAWSSGIVTSTSGTVGTADGISSGTWQIYQTRTSTGNGVSAGTWTASAGNMFDCVAEVVWSGNDDTDFINGTTDAGTNYQFFTFSAFSVPSTATIVSVNVYERTSDVGGAGNNNVRTGLMVNGTNYYSSTRNPPANGSQTWVTNSWATNPNTGAAWTVNDVNGTGANPLQQFGVSSTDGNPDIKVYSTFIYVIYTDNEYTALDETSPDDTDFVATTTAGGGYTLMTYPAFSIPAGSVITNLTVYYRHNDLATGVNNARAAIRVNGTVYNTTDAGVNPTFQTWTTSSYSFTTNPNTGANWTAADINGTGANPLQEFGIASSDSSPQVIVSMAYAVVNYTEYNDQLKVDVSWDGGASWSAVQTTNLTGTETTTWYDVTSATNWTPAKLANGQLIVRALAQSVNTAENVWLDWLPVEVTSSDLSLWPETYSGYGISLTGSYISAVEVGIEAYAASSEKVELEVTWNNGTNWSTKQTSAALGGSDPGSPTWFDFTSATSWTSTLLNDSNFKVRITYKDNGAYGQVSLDYIPVRISYRYTYGILASQVFDTAVSSSRWDALILDSTIPGGTNIAMEVRASDTPFLKTDGSPSWTSITGSSLSSGALTNSPTSNTGAAWTNPTNAYANDSSYASITSGTPSGSNIWGTYGFSLAGKTINQVMVRYDAWHGTLGSVSAWVSPTSDIANGWTNPTLAYNGNTGDWASIDVSGGATSPYLELYLSSNITSDKVRIWSGRQGTRIANIDVDVYYNAQWNNIYSGTLVVDSYQEYPIGSTQTVSGMRMRYSSTGSPTQAAYVAEAQFNSLTPATAPQIRVDVSWDGGSSWSSTQNTALSASETTYWYDVTSATSWDDTKLNDTNLKVRALAYSTFGDVEVRLDWLAVEVSYTPGATGSLSIPNGSGRYKQWRAIFTTGDANTPTLSEVRLYYDGG